MICQYIDSRKEEFGVEPICTTLSKAGVQIAPSAYYARRSRSPSARSLRDEILKAEISKVYKDNYSVLGTRKIHVMLNRPEIAERHGAGHVARCTVERLMGDLGLARRPPRQVPAHHAQRTARAVWTAGGFSDSACFVLQAAFFRSRKSLSASSGVRYPRAE